ncbi:MAG: GTP-binding protein [Promethearchaeota archaeon]|nr:MAG: GTP-binding protein [Candidatus Lokiarchaeota archaeon]
MIISETYKFKVTLFGSGGVGKTSLLIRYIKDYFNPNLKQTIGSNFLIKDVELQNNNVRLLLWDIGGQEQFSKLRTIYFKGSNAALGVYDVTSPQSLLKLPGWVSSIKKTVKKTIPMLVLGNKIDLERTVERSEAEDLSKRLNCEYLETSAKTGENVDKAFELIAKACLETISERIID